MMAAVVADPAAPNPAAGVGGGFFVTFIVMAELIDDITAASLAFSQHLPITRNAG